jgi:hypothetical protein
MCLYLYTGNQGKLILFFSQIFDFFVCNQTGNHPQEDVKEMTVVCRKIYWFIVKSDYKPKIKYKSLIIFLYFCLHNKIK